MGKFLWTVVLSTSKNIPTKFQVSLKFENRIGYSFSKDNNSIKYINNTFWLSNIRNYTKKAATENIQEKKDCYSYKNTHEQFKIGGPNKFYNTYSGKSIAE